MELGNLWIALLAGLILVEFQAWRPWACKALLRIASASAPKRHRARLAEEWAGNVDDFPGDLAKLLFALGCVLAGSKLTIFSWARLVYLTVVFVAVGAPGFVGVYRAGLDIRKLPKKMLKYPYMPPQVMALSAATKTSWMLYKVFVLGQELPPGKKRESATRVIPE